MSATPNNVGAGWNAPLPDSKLAGAGPDGEGGHNALQALLAFACIHEQAAKRRRRASGDGAAVAATEAPKEEQFALDEVLQLVSARAASITGADGVAIALAEQDAIICRASFGRIAPDPGIRLDPSSGFSGACLRTGQTVRCDDSETDDRVNAQVCRTLGTRSMIAVPLGTKQRVIGLVEAFSTEPYGFNDSDVCSLNLLGELILAAIRPEEENRLADIAKNIVVSEPAPATPIPPSAKPTEAPVVAAAERSRIVDEKFTPLRDREVDSRGEHGVDATSAAPRSAADLVINQAVAVAEPQPTVAPAEAVGEREEEAAVEPASKRRPLAGIGMIAALVLVVTGLGWAIWSKIKHAEQAISANTQPPVEVKTNEGEAREVILPAPAEVKPGPTPQVTGLNNFSSADSSTVVIDLQDQVQYEEHSLDNPTRIYVDLHDTKIAPGLANKVVDIDDAFLKRVRMAQPVEGVTRVVLEMKDQAEFSGVRLDANPYRLTIEVHKAGLTPASKIRSIPLAKPSPVISVSPKKEGLRSKASPKEFQIVLDAGHGGWDLGTVGKKGLLEKDLVLDIVGRLGKLLETRLAAEVVYTRQDDSYVPLEKRAQIANLAGADLFLSVHANYSDLSTARGIETYYTNTYSSIKARTADDDPALKLVDWTGVDIRGKVIDSHRFAADIQQALCRGLVAETPDLRNRGVKAAQYVVLTGTQMPAVLAEVSFVSSPADEDHLQNSEYRQEIAQALFRGVEKYREDSKHTRLASVKKPQS